MTGTELSEFSRVEITAGQRTRCLKAQSSLCTPSFTRIVFFFPGLSYKPLPGQQKARSCLPVRNKGANSFRLMQTIFLL